MDHNTREFQARTKIFLDLASLHIASNAREVKAAKTKIEKELNQVLADMSRTASLVGVYALVGTNANRTTWESWVQENTSLSVAEADALVAKKNAREVADHEAFEVAVARMRAEEAAAAKAA